VVVGLEVEVPVRVGDGEDEGVVELESEVEGVLEGLAPMLREAVGEGDIVEVVVIVVVGVN